MKSNELNEWGYVKLLVGFTYMYSMWMTEMSEGKGRERGLLIRQ